MIYYLKDENSFKDFHNKTHQVGILSRETPSESRAFFSIFSSSPFSISGFVNEKNAKKDIDELIENQLKKKIKLSLFYNHWLDDMSRICKMFCSFQKKKRISFWLGSERGCKRFHVDMVNFRLLVTYTGNGTEILPDNAANRKAFTQGKSNDEIIKDKFLIKYVNEWDISIFRGGENGILHRTPDSALKKSSSILMRLDHPSFLEQIIQFNSIAR